MELALVVPILGAMLLGSAEFAILAYDSIEISDAARAGVAYGSQSTATATDITTMRAVAVAAAPDISGMTATPAESFACSSSPATQYSTSPATPPCLAGDHVVTYVKVTTTATITLPVHVPGFSRTFTLNGSAIMRVL